MKKRKKAYHKALQESVHLSEKYCQVGEEGKGGEGGREREVFVQLPFTSVCVFVSICHIYTSPYTPVVFCFTRKITKMYVYDVFLVDSRLLCCQPNCVIF